MDLHACVMTDRRPWPWSAALAGVQNIYPRTDALGVLWYGVNIYNGFLASGPKITSRFRARQILAAF